MSDARVLDDHDATVAAGRDLAATMQALDVDELVIFLIGDLGAGKTTFARGFLLGWGHEGRVPSPTYTLIEPYDLEGQRIYHIDLYRLADPAEADHLGLAELPGKRVIMLVEWPEHAAHRLPEPDLSVTLELAPGGRRQIRISPAGPVGRRILGHKNT